MKLQSDKETMILSIGMIVKNEEKYLKGCLDAIKPLLDSVKSELIIVDTGSTDSTVDIAKQYTDKIYYFDWINDFSAARNFGLSKCTGQWYMFLDADEIFVDVTELISFFNDESFNSKYNSACYITRNYKSLQFDEYDSHYNLRVARNTPTLRFKGAIHEYMDARHEPSYFFNDYAYHYGYAYDTQEQKNEKSERNLTLLDKELKENPYNLRTLYHYISIYPELDDKLISLIESAMEIARKQSKNPFIYPIFFRMILVHEIKGEIEKKLALLDELLAKCPNKSAVILEIFAFKAYTYIKEKEFDKAESEILKYLENYDKFEKNLLYKEDMLCLEANYCNNEAKEKIKDTLELCILKQERYDDYFKVLINNDFALMESIRYKSKIDAFIDSCVVADEKCFESLMEKIYSTCDEEKIDYLDYKLLVEYYKNPDFALKFKTCNFGLGELMNLVTKNEDINADVNNFIDKFNVLPEKYSEAIYLALKNNVDLTNFIEKTNLELLKAHLSAIIRYHNDLSELALKYRDENFFIASISNLNFGVLLFDYALNSADLLNEADKRAIYTRFSDYTSLFICNIYNPELLNESEISILPELHRFGYFISTAREELENGNKPGYLEKLKYAISSCPSKNRIIKFLLDDFSKTL